MDNIDQATQTAQVAVETTHASITWQDLSLGLWALIVAASFGVLKFISWFSTREIKRFWNDIDIRLDDRIKASEERIEAKLLERDEKIEKIAKGVEVIRGHYHDKTAMEAGVLNQLLHVAEKLDKKVDNTNDATKG